MISDFIVAVNELVRLYEQLEIPLADFFHGHWKDIMLQAWSQSEKVNEEALGDLRRIGVRVAEDTDNKSEEQMDEEQIGEELG